MGSTRSTRFRKAHSAPTAAQIRYLEDLRRRLGVSNSVPPKTRIGARDAIRDARRRLYGPESLQKQKAAAARRARYGPTGKPGKVTVTHISGPARS